MAENPWEETAELAAEQGKSRELDTRIGRLLKSWAIIITDANAFVADVPIECRCCSLRIILAGG